MNTLTRWLSKFASRDKRMAERKERLPLIVHFWDGGVPQAHKLKDISRCGLYLLTEQRWYPGSLVTLVMQREDVVASEPNCSITVNAKVVRSGTDGVGFAFITPEQPNRHLGEHTLPAGADKKTFQQFLDRLYDDHG